MLKKKKIPSKDDLDRNISYNQFSKFNFYIV